MKKIIFFIILSLANNAYCQITIMNTEAKKLQSDNFVYDSLRNMVPEKYEGEYTYHHLIGQTIMYCGEPYSLYRRKNYFKIGDYYRVDGILPDNTNKGLYHRLSLTNIKTGETGEEGGIFTKEYNFKWVVLGHYEKMKELYLNKEFIYVGTDDVFIDSYGKKADGLINLEYDTVSKNIPKESVWKCIDVQVKPRKKDDGMDLDKRSPIILIFDNPNYGKHYCYLESDQGTPYQTLLNKSLSYICGRFHLKSDYEQVILAERLAKNKRKANLIRKYGTAIANLIIQGKVRIGMTKQMCLESWGEPDDINTTIGSYGTHEQWVYGNGYYLYFENGKLTNIQN